MKVAARPSKPSKEIFLPLSRFLANAVFILLKREGEIGLQARVHAAHQGERQL